MSERGRMKEKLVTPITPLAEAPPPKRTALLNAFLVLNAISILVTLGVAVAQILIIVLVKNLSNVAVAIRVYTIGFCFIMILSELEWTAKIRELEVLKNWIYRGLSYSFIGLLTLEFTADRAEGRIASVFIEAAGYVQIGVGVLYFLLGVLCMKRIKDRQQAHYDTVKAARATLRAEGHHVGV